ncbi:MAG: ACT domain-containing protein [Firmicutes bacterium]|nr:ACT domain-containing protein [Bacillota bacterium]
MNIEKLGHELSVCKLRSLENIRKDSGFYFLGVTDQEISLVCRTDEVPADAYEREDGWRAFRIVGILDFLLVGILSRISSLLAENSIGIFAVSTYNTDYILVKKESFEKALAVLADAGYSVL